MGTKITYTMACKLTVYNYQLANYSKRKSITGCIQTVLDTTTVEYFDWDNEMNYLWISVDDKTLAHCQPLVARDYRTVQK